MITDTQFNSIDEALIFAVCNESKTITHRTLILNNVGEVRDSRIYFCHDSRAASYPCPFYETEDNKSYCVFNLEEMRSNPEK